MQEKDMIWIQICVEYIITILLGVYLEISPLLIEDGISFFAHSWKLQWKWTRKFHMLKQALILLIFHLYFRHKIQEKKN